MRSRAVQRMLRDRAYVPPREEPAVPKPPERISAFNLSTLIADGIAKRLRRDDPFTSMIISNSKGGD